MIKVRLYEHKESIKFFRLLWLFVMAFSCFSSSGGLLLVLLLIGLSYRRIIAILDRFNIQDDASDLVIYPDGAVSVLRGDQVLAQAHIDERQWISSQMCVIRVVTDQGIRSYTALAVQQTDKDVFRRLICRFRHSFYRPAALSQVVVNNPY